MGNHFSNLAVAKTSIDHQPPTPSRKLLCATACLALGFSALAFAQPPYSTDLVQGGNRWVLDAFDDTSPDHLQLANPSPGICFEYAGTAGTHQRYTWYSDTFPNWHGTASQEADQIFMHGVYDDGRGRDAIQLKIIINTPRSGSVGHWQEWRDDGNYGQVVGFANARMIRDPGAPCGMTAAESRNNSFFSLFNFFGNSNNPMTYVP